MQISISRGAVGLVCFIAVAWVGGGCNPPPPPARSAAAAAAPTADQPTAAPATKPAAPPASKNPLGNAISATRQNIAKIQQHGLIDLEVQQQLAAVLAGYKEMLEQRGTGPADWNELIQTGRSIDLLRDAEQRGTRLAFGITAEQWADPATATGNLALVPNSETGGGWALRVDGSISELDAVGYEAATLLNQ